jgi:hypothetical protein
MFCPSSSSDGPSETAIVAVVETSLSATSAPGQLVASVCEPLRQTPHANRIHLDQIGEARFVLTDSVTLERQALPVGDWVLLFDEDEGFGCVVRVDDNDLHQAFLVEEMMNKDVLESDSGERWQVQTKDSNKRHCLDQLQAQYHSADVTVRAGTTAGSLALQAYIFVVPRQCGMRVFWNMFDLYIALQLDTYFKNPSKWSYNIITTGARAFKAQLGMNRFIASRHINVSVKKLSELPWSERCLPQPSCSSLQLLTMLYQFALLSRERGGVKSPVARLAAKDILIALIRKALSREKGRCFQFSTNVEWSCLWPRPSILYNTLHSSVELSFVPPCSINLQSLLAEPADEQFSPSVLLCRIALLREGFSPIAPSVPLLDVFSKLCGNQSFDYFVAQLFYALSTQLELALAEQRDDGTSPISFTWANGISHKSQDMEMKLVAYRQNAQLESMNHNVISISSDKGNPCSMNLLNTLICFPTNVMVLCCPVVFAMLVADIHIYRFGPLHIYPLGPYIYSLLGSWNFVLEALVPRSTL